MRVTLSSDPFPDANDVWGQGPWPAQWVHFPSPVPIPSVLAFRLRFSVPSAALVRVHVTANERYRLYLDGRLAGEGSERGDADRWYFESYDLTLAGGDHVLVAIVWALGDAAPLAQISTGQPRFLLAAESAPHPLDTGAAPWEVVPISGYRFPGPGPAWGTGSKIELDGTAYPWGVESGQTEGWKPAAPGDEARPGIGEWGYSTARLLPATLPPMLNQPRRAGHVRHARFLASGEDHGDRVDPGCHDSALAAAWTGLIENDVPLVVPADTRQQVVIDLRTYVCAYPELELSGGARSRVRIEWAESLYADAESDDKGHRDDVDGKWFRGAGDRFTADGIKNRRFSTLWWQAGRYLRVDVTTAGEPLILEKLALRETRYPLECEASFCFSDTRLEGLLPLLVRSVQTCAHETYVDCPFYEQLMYVGDTRLEALLTYTMTADPRLPVKAIRLFGDSCDHTGLTASRHPARGRQTIPGFSLWWIAMVHDLALWRGERVVVVSCLPRIRGILDAFLAHRRPDGLVRVPDGWHFVDWVPSWERGCPPLGRDHCCGITSWQLVLALRQAAELEAWAGEAALGKRCENLARELGAATEKAFWNPRRGLMADDPAHLHWSQHAQCLAILSGHLAPEQASRLADTMQRDPSIAHTTIYFSHYLLEALAATEKGDALLSQLTPWFSLAENGFRTTFESPGHTRSDCHAWGAHPLYHYTASILGVRPSDFGYGEVTIRPQLGAMTHAAGRLVHPRGPIETSFSRSEAGIQATIALPSGLQGTLIHGPQSYPLQSGSQSLFLPRIS